MKISKKLAHVNLHVTPELKQEIIKRELDRLGYSI